jgi:hypothetical protein
MKIIFIIIFNLLALNGFCQKYIEIPNNAFDSTYFNNIKGNVVEFNLDDLTTSSDSLRVRIWMGNNIVELIYSENISTVLTTWMYPTSPNSKPIIHYITFDIETSQILSDSLMFYNILEIEDDQSIGIDGNTYLFEVATPENYRLYSFWSPTATRSSDSKNVIGILNVTHRILNLSENMGNFIESLEAGTYQWGMSTIELDYLLPKQSKKSSLYNFVEEKLRTDLGIDELTSHLKFPLIMINNEKRLMKDLKNYEYKQLKEFNLIEDTTARAIYGQRGEFGVVLIKIK